MKEKWQALNQREQYLVLFMSIFIGIFVIYSAIWQPINDSIEEKKAKVARYQELLVWVNDKKIEYNRYASASRGKSSASLSNVINTSASQYKISIARIQPKGSEIMVTIDEVAFNTLMDWLKTMAINDGVTIKAIDLARSDIKGAVKVRRLSLGKG
mgnify:CR=1 FL=1